MKSFAILRTNVGLTTNVKIVVDSKYNLALDSIDSTPDLTISKYKKLSFNKTNYYDELVPFLWEKLPSEIAFHIKYENDNDSMTDNFANQYDEIYQYGARNILNNKNYIEEYEYFAPLYITKGKLPSNFIIFRVDGLGLLSLDRFNFNKELVSKFKTVKLFDLSKKTNLGEWLDTNFVKNKFFPDTPLEMNFRRLEFSKWYGIDYNTGGYIHRSLFLDDYLEKENEIFESERFIFDGYKNNKIIFPNILNFSFLFDDTPANDVSLRKWSINRYYGFYLNSLDLVKTISPYDPPKLKSNIKVLENNILDSNGLPPFVDGWDDNKDYYVEYLGSYYKVEKYSEKSNYVTTAVKKSSNLVSDEVIKPVVDVWKIISEINLYDKQDLLNDNLGKIDSNKRLVDFDGNKIVIDDFDKSDVWIIEIDGVYHNLITDDSGYLKLYTDFSFEFSENNFIYWINKSNPASSINVSFNLTKGEKPKKFSIYKLNFTDIKDFDDRIVDTEYSKFEYEKSSDITDTDETKMYVLNLSENTFPQSFDNFTYKNNNEHIPVSSEYTANHETFKIENNDLTPLWRKNPVYCRWVYSHSLSANDYPYLFNNSKVFERFNRTTNTYDDDTHRGERTLDYFYTINSSTFSYLHHTLHVENNNDYGIDNNFFFDFNKYLAKKTYITGTNSTKLYDFDYFTWFFERKTSFLNNKIKKNVTKYSYFNKGDKSSPNVTLFKGIKFLIYDVENIRKNSNSQLEVVNTKSSNKYEDYKFSILLTSDDNGMDWNIIQNWEMEKIYASGSIVLHDDILYQATIENVVNEPSFTYKYSDKQNNTFSVEIKSSPYSTLSSINGYLPDLSTQAGKSNKYWKLYTDIYSPYWNPYKSSLLTNNPNGYNSNSIVYNSGEWYVYNSNAIGNSGGSVDFWNPYISLQYGTPYIYTGTTNPISNGYQKDSIVMYKGELYKSLINYNYQAPDYKQQFRNYDEYEESSVGDDVIISSKKIGNYWSNSWEKIKSTTLISKWDKIEIWNPSKNYQFNKYVVHNDIVYISTNYNQVNSYVRNGEEPGISLYWIRTYSLEPDTNFVYETESNPYTLMNDELYRIKQNPNKNTLENGIKIYINKKWKNILVNISINDNTLINTKNSDRDDLYSLINKKLTANNFIKCINDLTNKYDFSDYVKYIIIDENLNINEYNYENIEDLPLILFCEKPERLNFKVDSLIKKPIFNDKLKPTKILNNGYVTDLNELNYYNNTNIANSIVDNLDPSSVITKYHGISNITQDTIFRFSGDYMPLFYEIDIFRKDNYTSYNEIQLVFYTNIDDEFVFTFTKNGITVTENFTIYKDNYYEQIINIIYNHSLFSGADFIFEILDSNSNDLNDDLNNKLDGVSYDVLSIKYKSSYGNIQIITTQIKPILLFDIQNSSSSTNIIFVLSATSGHPPYEYSFGYTSGFTVVPRTSYSTDVTYYADKQGALDNIESKIKLEIYVRDSYGATSQGGQYTLNSNLDIVTEVSSSIFYYEFI
jgi:hypothetical protein